MERKENFPGCPGKMVGVHGAGIGCYERDEVKPSIEIVLSYGLFYITNSMKQQLLVMNIIRYCRTS